MGLLVYGVNIFVLLDFMVWVVIRFVYCVNIVFYVILWVVKV